MSVTDPPDVAARSVAYGGFWRRLGALVVDGLVMLPLTIVGFVASGSKVLAIGWPVVTLLVVAVYSVGMHARFGQTLGKMATGIRVVRLDGTPIDLRDAFVRYSPFLLFGLVETASSAIGASRIPDVDYAAHSRADLQRRAQELAPALLTVGRIVGALWVLAELVYMLTNPRRRALHDLLAGTVVIRDPRSA